MAKSPVIPQEFDLKEALVQLDQLEKYFASSELDLEAGIAKHAEAIELSKKIAAYLTSVSSRLDVLESDLS